MTRASDLAKLLGAGATINDGTTITTADNTSQLILQSTDADATRGPTLTMQRDSSSPADNDVAGQIFFNADNDAAEDTTYADVFVKLTDVSNGTEDASISFRQISNGSLKEVVMQNGNVDFGDGSGVRLGDGQDFQLYHDGTDNHINVTNAQTLNIQTSGNNAIVVDANGVVTMPKQPIFIATAENTISLSTSFAELTAFSNAQVNIGTHYNTSNGRFTAPVAGTYQFAVNSIGNAASTVYRYRIYKNGSSLLNYSYRIDTTSGGGNQYGTNGEYCIVATLSASDYISIFARSDNGSDAYANTSYRYSYFRGQLIG